MRTRFVHPSLLVLLAVLGCEGSPTHVANGDGELTIWTARFGSGSWPAVDVLLIVDTTAQANDLRQEVVEELPQALDQFGYPGGLPSLHFGVVASGSGESPACADSTPSPMQTCGMDSAYGYLATGACGADFLSSESPAQIAPCLATLPESDCDQGDPLEVLARTIANPAEAGLNGPAAFLRPDALLLVVIVSSRTGASGGGAKATPVADVLAAINAAKPDQYSVRTLVGVPPPASCGDMTVFPPLDERLHDFVDSFGQSGLIGELCPGTFVKMFADFFYREGGAPASCVPAIAVTESKTAVGQTNCVVEDLVDDPAGSSDFVVIPQCANPSSALPCWRFVSSDACQDGLRVDIEREPGFCPQVQTIDRITCAGQNQ